MIKKKDFKNNIKTILNNDNIEGLPIMQKSIISEIFKDEDLEDLFFNGFVENYKLTYGKEDDMCFCKTEDFLRRLDIIINDFIIPNPYKNENIKDSLIDLINNDVSFFDAVNFDDNDKQEILEDIHYVLSDKRIKL